MKMLCEEKKAKGTAVALGYFDGIHMGHQAVLNKALEMAEEKGLTPVVMLFDIHPRKLLTGKVPPILLSEERKRGLLKEMGFEVFEFGFREAMNYSPEQFEEKILLGQLNAKVVVCGYDYHYGKGGKGSPETLKNELTPKNIEVYSLSPVYLGEEAVSSTKIRHLINDGEIERANYMLGDYFTYDFTVEKGDGIGHKLGFPTINQFFPEDFIIPKYGVYASRVKIDGRLYASVTNIGTRPTVSGENMRSETCIFDFDGDLYGRRVEVSLMKFLREEKKFPSLSELKEAVSKDITKAKEIYKESVEK
ncbi:MAG: bifunctional riboflavin kinase/FAD synthetase [Ruminococcaceae bacterium]|nr:bifunctional riboflavin kinase/FAD synthetase [Oscillospiraceae bacterium]